MTKVLINSAERVNGTPSDFVIQLTRPIEAGTYTVENIQLPNCIYTVNSNNNKIYYYDTINRTATLTNKFYTARELANEVQTQLNTTSSGVNSFTVTYDKKSSKFTIEADSTTFYFTFGTNTASSARKLLGFNKLDGEANSSHTSDNLINLSEPKKLLVQINDIRNYFLSNSSCTLIIERCGLPNDIGWYAENELIQLRERTSTITVKVIDIDRNSLDFNGIDWTFELKIA